MKPNFACTRLMIVVLFSVTLNLPSNADTWNQFRGPNGSGVIETSNLPERFETDENLIWKVSLPLGHSSPILTKNHIFITGHAGNQLLTLCLDRRTGALLWKQSVSKRREDKRHALNDSAAPSPVTDGENVYAFFSEFGLLSYNAQGKLRWQLPLGPFDSMWGIGTSPILVNDSLFLQCDYDGGSYLLKVDKDTGRIHWKKERPGIQSGYSTPAVWKDKSGASQLIVAGTFEIAGYSLTKGERLWRTGGLAFQAKGIPVIGTEMIYYNNVGFEAGPLPPQPLFDSLLKDYDSDGDSRLSPAEFSKHPRFGNLFRQLDSNRNGFAEEFEWRFIVDAAKAENALLAIRPEGKGDMGRNNVQWTYAKSLPDVPTPVLYKGVLYIVRNGGILTSLDPQTGTPIKQGRLSSASGAYYSSPVAADGKLFFLSQEGKLTVVKAAREWEELSVSDLGDDCMATPAIGEGRVYIRTRESLRCFGKAN